MFGYHLPLKPFFLIILLCFLFVSNLQSSFAQPTVDVKSYSSLGGELNDYIGEYRVDSFNIEITDLPKEIDASFGLSRICFTIFHDRVSDLKVWLRSPDGTEVWLTNRNISSGKNYTNTCFSNGPTFNGSIGQGVAPYTGEYKPDGRLSFFNNEQNPNGVWTLFVQDLQREVEGRLNDFRLEFSPNPPMDEQSGCDFDKAQNCHCPSDEETCDLLPDLVLMPQITEGQIQEYAQNDPNYPGQIRFATSMLNIGSGPFEVTGNSDWRCKNKLVDDPKSPCPNQTSPRQTISQRIYHKVSGDSLIVRETEASTSYFDSKAGHYHYHVDDWVEFRLLKKKKRKNKIVATSSKVSFCLFDYGICNDQFGCLIDSIYIGKDDLKNYGIGDYTGCNEDVQGISVGGYDNYGLLYEGQYIKLPPRIRNGSYILEIVIDPKGYYEEENKANNIMRFPFELTKQKH